MFTAIVVIALLIVMTAMYTVFAFTNFRNTPMGLRLTLKVSDMRIRMRDRIRHLYMWHLWGHVYRLKLWHERNIKFPLAARARGFRLPKVYHDEPFPAGDNVLRHDPAHMATLLVRGWVVLHEGYGLPDGTSQLTYLILANERTGQRITVHLR